MEKVYAEFHTINNRKVTLRTARMSDLNDFLDFINSLVDEQADLLLEERLTLENEVDWLRNLLAEIEKGVVISVIAEVDGSIIGNSGVRLGIERTSHVGLLYIAVKNGYRNAGIGTEMMQILIEESRRIGLELLHLTVFDSNQQAKYLYEKIGFKEVGRWPKVVQEGSGYVDEICMALEL
jgi:ribosomal protein S18 acetylase RimI-like enzyme